ncbi:hypothetical protein [Aureivirga marina]|uniref:hypothetical protein n=1 Tax=Aureivirga marina TaxID=1182451 RepID=UPI0018CB78E7|nr:hypothetical protein [Aureivirga marina]
MEIEPTLEKEQDKKVKNNTSKLVTEPLEKMKEKVSDSSKNTRSFGKEISELFLDIIKRRARNPLISNFIIAFIFLNWKAFIYLFFSDDKINIKLNSIENYYSFDYWSLGYLILIVAIYNFGLPHLVALANKVSNNSNQKINKNNSETLQEKLKNELKEIQNKNEIEKELIRGREIKNEIDEINKLKSKNKELLEQIRNFEDKNRYLNLYKISLLNKYNRREFIKKYYTSIENFKTSFPFNENEKYYNKLLLNKKEKIIHKIDYFEYLLEEEGKAQVNDLYYQFLQKLKSKTVILTDSIDTKHEEIEEDNGNIIEYMKLVYIETPILIELLKQFEEYKESKIEV